MHSYQVKVCGMRNHANIEALVAVQPDFIGFIFYPRSKRYVGDDPDARIFNQVPAHIKKVGVFVNAATAVVLDKVKDFGLQAVQLHGEESADDCRFLKAQGLEVIKTFSVQDALPLGKMNRYRDVTDYFLFDTCTPQFGGSGKKFNWTMLQDYPLDKPVFLSGGIGPADAVSLKAMSLPFIEVLDINSRFELEPGVKDMDQVKQFIQTIRQ